MTREPNGDVGRMPRRGVKIRAICTPLEPFSHSHGAARARATVWETSMGTCVKMMDRWQGVQLSAQEKAALEAETAKVNRGANVGGKADKMFSALRKGAAALGDAADGAPEQAEAMPDPNEEIAGNLDIHLLSSAEEMLCARPNRLAPPI
jgi:hypothetical protein